jgi:hypothetical protein
VTGEIRYPPTPSPARGGGGERLYAGVRVDCQVTICQVPFRFA